MYSASLAQASSQGVIFSVLIVAIAFGVYSVLSRRADILGASVLMFIAGFMARDYYHIVYAAGAMLGIALIMQLTEFDEGTVRGSLFYAGVGLFTSTILYYLLPATIPGDINQAFIIALLPAAVIVLAEGLKGGFNYDSEAVIAIIAAFALAFIFISQVGVTHLIWGVALMAFGILMEYLTGGFIAVTSFTAGFIIWLDDVVGYTAYNQNQHALSLLLPVGLVLIGAFLFMQWRG